MKQYINPANDYKVTDGGRFCWLWFIGGILFETSCILAKNKKWMGLCRAERIWCRIAWPIAMTIAIVFDNVGIADKVAGKEK